MAVQKKKPERASCPECGRRFTKNRSWQKWCSPACGMANWLRLHPRVKIEDPGSGPAQCQPCEKEGKDQDQTPCG